MFINKRFSWFYSVLVPLLLLIPAVLTADFTGMNFGAKTMALGNCGVSLSDQPSQLLINPASLSFQQRMIVSVSHENLYGIPDLYNSMITMSLPLSKLHAGIGFTQLMLSGEYAEQVGFAACASTFRLGGVTMGMGLNLKGYYADFMNGVSSVSGTEGKASLTKFDMDAGLIARKNGFQVGYAARNMLEPRFQFDTNSNPVIMKQAFGMSYKSPNGLVLTSDYLWDRDRSSWHVGGEIWFYDVFAPRVGMSGSQMTAGFGLKTRQWMLDGAILANGDLGSTYRIELSWIFR